MSDICQIEKVDSELLHNAFVHAPIGKAFLDEKGALIKVNSAFCLFLGYSEQELLNMNFRDISHPDDLIVDLEYNEKLLKGELSTFQMEKRYIHKNGSIRWGLLMVSRVSLSNSVLTIGQVVDITDKKQSEVEMNRLKSFYNLSSEGIAMFDLEGKVMNINPAFEEMFGWMESEIKGHRLPVTPNFMLTDAEYLISEAVEGRRVTDFETLKQKKDGTLLLTCINMSPIVDENNRIIGLTGTVRDITHQKEVSTLLQSFFKHNIDAILTFDHNGIVNNINEAFVTTFGWKKEEVIGVSITDLPFISEDIRRNAEDLRDILLSGKNVREVESKRLTKDGFVLDVMVNGFSIKNHEELVSGYAVILRDITEKKKTEELILQSEKLSVAGQLAASIAHEIRNPMTAIKGFIKLLKYSEEKDQYYEILENEIARIELILSELLTLAKPQKSNLIYSDVRSILAQVISLLEAEANMKSIEIIRKFSTGHPLLLVDENQIKQVFINFIKNAIEAMPDGGSLSVDVENGKDQNLMIRISDTGCGIPKEILAKMCQPFFTTKEKGTGLGFMISKSIIENHNGTVTLTSEQNKGTTIQISLPTQSELRDSSRGEY